MQVTSQTYPFPINTGNNSVDIAEIHRYLQNVALGVVPNQSGTVSQPQLNTGTFVIGVNFLIPFPSIPRMILTANDYDVTKLTLADVQITGRTVKGFTISYRVISSSGTSTINFDWFATPFI